MFLSKLCLQLNYYVILNQMNSLIFLMHCCLVGAISANVAKRGLSTLSSWVCLLAVSANFFVLKQIELFDLTVTCSDAYVVGAMLSLSVVQRQWGPRAAKSLVWTSLTLVLCFTLFSQLQLLYSPAVQDTAHENYFALLSTSPRIALSSVLAFFLSQRLDITLFSRLESLPFALRAYLATAISQFFDTLMFTFLALGGLVAAPWHILFVSYGVKLFTLSAMTVFFLREKALWPSSSN